MYAGYANYTICIHSCFAEIDEDLQSRQLAVYGKAAMSKMMASRVLITGKDSAWFTGSLRYFAIPSWVHMYPFASACIGVAVHLSK